MADDQQFCLRWNNHQSTLISVFDTLLENGTLVDCTLAAEGQSLKAHKVVLSACSPYLETLLSEHYEKHPIIIMKDVKFTELKSMMDYMYRGEVNICQDQLGTFLKAAESLQIKGLSENGEGDARDVGSTTTRPPPPKRPPATPAARTDPEQPPAASPAHRPRDGSISPSSRKRRRTRRNSDDANHFDSNSCDLPLTPAQSTPVVPIIPASITSTPIRTPVVKPEINDRLDHNSLPPESGLLKEKIEPAEQLLEPKTEYLEDLNNDDSVEDLTLDDDDEMDMSQMSNMSNMSRPGPSHGTDISNQGFSPWQLGNQSGGNDEVFMAAQEAVNSHRDSQDSAPLYRRSLKKRSYKVADENSEHIECSFTCSNCDQKFTLLKTWKKHVYLECRKKLFKCSVCHVFTTRKKLELIRHMRDSHQDLKGTNESHNNADKDSEDIEGFVTCSNCDQKFSLLKTRKKHVDLECGKKLFTCSVCHVFTTRKKLELIRHMRDSHQDLKGTNGSHNNADKNSEDIEGFFPCPQCGQKFKSQNTRKKHEDLECGKTLFTCSVCQTFTTKTKLELIRHMRDSHQDFKENNGSHNNADENSEDIEGFFPCPQCGQKFKSEKTLKKHVDLECGKTLFTCSVCQCFTTRSKLTLNRHMRFSHKDSKRNERIPLLQPNGRQDAKTKSRKSVEKIQTCKGKIKLC